MPNSFTGIIGEIRISVWFVGSEMLMVQQAQEQKGEHKSIWALFSKSAPWEITAVCCAPITTSSSQGSAENVMVIIDMMIAIIFTAQIYK